MREFLRDLFVIDHPYSFHSLCPRLSVKLILMTGQQKIPKLVIPRGAVRVSIDENSSGTGRLTMTDHSRRAPEGTVGETTGLFLNELVAATCRLHFRQLKIFLEE